MTRHAQPDSSSTSDPRRTPPSHDATASYLKVTRQTLGLSLQAVASRLNVSPQAVHQFEKSEAAGAISMRQLEKVAAAMGYRLCYSLLPRDSDQERNAPRSPGNATTEIATPRVAPIEYSMLLENQAADRFD